ncbi:MAG: cell division protein FtsA [Bacteroidales bacterium]|jgi:cell division protein FtsA|nr:cell division protein FtsA [Bacteroidales bacterium]
MVVKKRQLDEDNFVVGLDIGTTKIVTVIGQRGEDGRVTVLGHGKGESTGVQHGLVINLDKTIAGIQTSMEAAYQRCPPNYEIKEAYVGIAGRHIKNIEYKHVVTRISKRDKPIRYEEIEQMRLDLLNISVPADERIIDVIPQKFTIDREHTAVDPVGMIGELIEGCFQIVTAKYADVKKIIYCVEQTGVKFKEIVLEPVASGLACLQEEEKKQGVALIDIGGGTTDLAIFLDGAPVYAKVIPIGGNIITHDIAAVCKIAEEQAEILKIRYGSCVMEKTNPDNFIRIAKRNATQKIQISEHMLSQIIHARVSNDMLLPIKTAIENSGYKDKIVMGHGIVLTGGGAKLKHLLDLTRFMFDVPVRVGTPEVGFDRSMSTELRDSIYSTSLGLLKFGIEKQEQNNPAAEENMNTTSLTPEIDRTSPWNKAKEIFDKTTKILGDILNQSN